MMDIVRRLTVGTFLAVLLLLSCAPRASAQPAAADCTQWEECRDRALEARENRQYERFHDLAWRAIQTGTPNDPALMYLLARAQALSGRRRDALIMLRRLADMGVATDAAAEEDLRRVRELPGWREIETRFEQLRAAPAKAPGSPAAAKPNVSAAGDVAPAPGAASAVVPPVSPDAAPASPSPPAPAPAAPPLSPAAPAAAASPSSPAPTPAASPRAPAAAPSPEAAAPAAKAAGGIAKAPGLPAPAAAAPPEAAPVAPAPPAAAAVASPVTIEPLPATDAASFSTTGFSPAGLAYDEVSRRFLFGDTDGRRLFVVGEGSQRAVDLVRGDSAGFHDVTGLEIGRRGDLWVTSTAADGGAAAIHRLQLISGRALDTFAAPTDEPVALTDLSVAPDGTVLALDGRSARVLRLRTGAKAIETAMSLDVTAPGSLTVADDRTVFVAHASGLVRVDLQQRRVRTVSAPAGMTLEGLQRIRWHRNSLVAIQHLDDGSRVLSVLSLDRAGTRVTGARVIDPDLEGDDRTPLLTIVGDDVYYSMVEARPSGDATVDVLVRRIRLP